MSFDEARNWAIIVGAVVAILTFVKAIYEYTFENKRKRAELFLKLRESFKTNERFSDLFDMIENNDISLRNINYSKKQDFLGFYEDLALLVNSGILKTEIAHYMFAYYSIKCWESDNFWHELNRDSPYWALFRHFVQRMKSFERELAGNSASVVKYKL